MNKSTSCNYFIGMFLLFIPLSLCAKTTEFYLTLESHVFIPSELKIPANTKVKLIIHNKDKTAEEFDSFDLNREKVLFPNKKTTPLFEKFLLDHLPQVNMNILVNIILDLQEALL